jgi:hypothetical protein
MPIPATVDALTGLITDQLLTAIRTRRTTTTSALGLWAIGVECPDLGKSEVTTGDFSNFLHLEKRLHSSDSLLLLFGQILKYRDVNITVLAKWPLLWPTLTDNLRALIHGSLCAMIFWDCC